MPSVEPVIGPLSAVPPMVIAPPSPMASTPAPPLPVIAFEELILIWPVPVSWANTPSVAPVTLSPRLMVMPFGELAPVVASMP